MKLVPTAAKKPILFTLLAVTLVICLQILPTDTFASISGDKRHPDPPTNPPILSFIDPTTVTIFSDVDDGINFVAEIFVLINVTSWGPGHNHNDIWLWRQSVNLEGAGPWVFTFGEQPLTHLECTPFGTVTMTTQVWEIDEGVDTIWLVLSGATGAALGSGGGALTAGGGSIAGISIPYIIDWLNDNDPLGIDDAEVAITFYTVPQAPSNICSSTDAPPPGLPDIPLPPGTPEPPDVPGPETPQPGSVQPDDTYFRNYEMPTNHRQAEQTDDPFRKSQYLASNAFGVDDYHPFGRSTIYAENRFDFLHQALAAVDADVLEPGDDITVTPSEFIQFQENLRGLLALFAYNAAALAWGEAVVAGIAEVYVTDAEGYMNLARNAANDGDFATCFDNYRIATTLLLEQLHPEYLNGNIYGDCNNNGIIDYLEIYLGQVEDIDEDGYPDECGIAAVGEGETYNQNRILLSSTPNPFNAATEIRFQLAQASEVEIQIYNSAGRMVRSYTLSDQPIGEGSIVWRGDDQNGRILASGTYLVRLTTGEIQETSRVTLLK